MIGFFALERSDSDTPLLHCFAPALRAPDGCDEGRPARITVSADDPEHTVLRFHALDGDGDGAHEDLGAFLRENFDLADLHGNFRAIQAVFEQ